MARSEVRDEQAAVYSMHGHVKEGATEAAADKGNLPCPTRHPRRQYEYAIMQPRETRTA